jgi:hypothetical protein
MKQADHGTIFLMLIVAAMFLVLAISTVIIGDLVSGVACGIAAVACCWAVVMEIKN